MKKPFFPIFVDISEKKIVVIGGGKIAQRRVETLLLFAEHILVISPEVTETLKELTGQKKISWIASAYGVSEEEDVRIDRLIKAADMVLVATDDSDCNERIVRLCNQAEIPVNTAHKKELCDFYFPAIVARDPIVTGITASGLNHESVRRARECIESALDSFTERNINN